MALNSIDGASNDSTMVRTTEITPRQIQNETLSVWLEDEGNGVFELSDVKGDVRNLDLNLLEQFVGKNIEEYRDKINNAIKSLLVLKISSNEAETPETLDSTNNVSKDNKVAYDPEQALLNAQSKILERATYLLNPGTEKSYDIMAEYEADGDTFVQWRKITVAKDRDGQVKLISDELASPTPLWTSKTFMGEIQNRFS